MRVAFLCGCAEGGEDGVGDYTVELAEECGRRGIGTLCVALNDPFLTGEKEGDGVLRLGAGMRWEERVERAREAIEEFGADAVSLQWVPYGFHERGVPWGIEKGLKRIVGGRRRRGRGEEQSFWGGAAWDFEKVIEEFERGVCADE